METSRCRAATATWIFRGDESRPAHASGTAAVDEAVARGLRAVERQDFLEAETHFREGLALEPTRVAARYGLARTLAHQYRYEEAEQELRAARALNPSHWLRFGVERILRQKKSAGTTTAADEAITRGQLANHRHAFGEAVVHFREAVALDQEHVRARVVLGAELNLRGKYDEAEPHLRRAIALDPEHVEARVELAYLVASTPRGVDATSFTSGAENTFAVPWSRFALVATIIAGLAGLAYLRRKKKQHAELAAWVDRELAQPPRRVARKKAEPAAARRRKMRARGGPRTAAADLAPAVESTQVSETEPQSDADEDPTSDADEDLPSDAAAAPRAMAEPPSVVVAAAAPPRPSDDQDEAKATASSSIERDESKADEKKEDEETPRGGAVTEASRGVAETETPRDVDTPRGVAESKEEEEEPTHRAAPVGDSELFAFLGGLGLSALAPRFADELIDAATLRLLTVEDLESMRIPPAAAQAIVEAVSDATAAGSKKLVIHELLDDAEEHQAKVQSELDDHRAELARLKHVLVRRIPETLVCPISRVAGVMRTGRGDAAVTTWIFRGDAATTT